MSRDLLLLLRAPLAATAVSNLLIGLALARPEALALSPRLLLATALLAAGSCALYWSGMVLNDWFDRERDAIEQPGRPIPSGRVSADLALTLGTGLLLGGIGLATLGAWVGAGEPLRGAFGGVMVSLCVLAYDGGLKRLRLVGGAAMGACRLSNALLGAYALGWWEPTSGATPAVVYAGTLGLYVTFLTYLSTWEREQAGPFAMTLGFGGTLLAPSLLVALPLMGQGWHPAGLLGGVALFGLVLAQLIAAILEGTRARAEATTRALLQGIWLLDLGALLARAPLELLGAWAALLAANKLGARALFRPPPPLQPSSSAAPDSPAAPSPGGSSPAPSDDVPAPAPETGATAPGTMQPDAAPAGEEPASEP
ncbi:MAG: UbiA family prenyltransferase [Planctomycetota bacterium]